MDLIDKRDMCTQKEVAVYCVFAIKKTKKEILERRIVFF